MRVFTSDTLFLARPSVAYAETFVEALREFHDEGYFVYQDTDEIVADFPTFVDQLLTDETREPTADRVPETHYWLIRSDRGTDTFVARGSIRHELTEHLRHIGGHIGYAVRPSERRKGYGTEILRLMLPEAKRLGINPVLITCDADNLGSRKIIEHNGGQFENAVQYYRDNEIVLKRRYWIHL